MVNKFINQPTIKEVVTKINELADAVNQDGGVSDVKVNNTSVVTSGVANINLTGYAKTSNLATVATSGSYNDLSNKPTIPDAQVQSNWTETNTSSKAYIKNKPTIPAAQIQSDWNQTTTTAKDYIKNKPTIPTVNNATITFTQGGIPKGTITTNQSTNTTIALDAGGGGGGASITDVLNVIYPVGSIYVSTNSVNPIASYVGTWELVAQDRVLQGSSTNHSAGTTIAAGLPNIKGFINFNTSYNTKGYSPIVANTVATGSLYILQKSSKTQSASITSTLYNTWDFGINANGSHSIYDDNNSTVQPPAYVVNIWKRTA